MSRTAMPFAKKIAIKICKTYLISSHYPPNLSFPPSKISLNYNQKPRKQLGDYFVLWKVYRIDNTLSFLLVHRPGIADTSVNASLCAFLQEHELGLRATLCLLTQTLCYSCCFFPFLICFGNCKVCLTLQLGDTDNYHWFSSA